MDFEELLPQQQSFDALAAYLNGSTVNVDRRTAIPQRYTGAYVTEDFLRILGVSPMMGRDFTAADNTPGAGEGGDHRLRHLAARLRRRAGHRRQGRPHQRQAGDHHRRDAERLRLPDERGALDSALQRVPAAAAQRSGRDQSRGARPAETGRLPRSGERRSDDDRAAASPTAYPDTNKQFNTGQVQPLLETFTPRPLRGTLLDDARVLRRRAAHLVRQRDEHAVRARDAARQGAGGSVVARRDRASG